MQLLHTRSLFLVLGLLAGTMAHAVVNIDYSTLGYHRVAAVSPKLVLANPMANAAVIADSTKTAAEKHATLVVFPELALTGYTAEDLFLTEELLANTKKALNFIRSKTKKTEATLLVGAPYQTPDGRLYNVAFVISKGQIIGAVPKVHLPNYAEFYERRWFTPGGIVEMDVEDAELGKFHLGTRQLFRQGSMTFAIEICEDLWAPINPATQAALAGANVIVNLSASNELVGKAEYRRQLVASTSDRLLSAYVYVSTGPAESTKDIVFGGHSMVYENGSKIAENERFQTEGTLLFADIDVQKIMHERRRNTTFTNMQATEKYALLPALAVKQTLPNLLRTYAKTPFIPTDPAQLHTTAEEIFNIQSTGLAQRLRTAGLKSMVIGVSGGLDSTLALLVAWHAAKKLNWQPSQIHGITMPGFGTTKGTKASAMALMQALGTSIEEIRIHDAVNQHFKDIGHDPSVHNPTYENAQARERTQILFDKANTLNGLVVGTGDLSELCLGWCTINGDHMSGYGVNASIPKTLVKHLVQWHADYRADENLKQILYSVLETEVSPELLPPSADGKIQQATESLVGPYRLHDFFIYHFLRNRFAPEKILVLATDTFKGEYTEEEIRKWLGEFFRRFFSQQFKRTTLPAGPKVGTVSISPRGDLRIPDEVNCADILLKVKTWGKP